MIVNNISINLMSFTGCNTIFSVPSSIHYHISSSPPAHPHDQRQRRRPACSHRNRASKEVTINRKWKIETIFGTCILWHTRVQGREGFRCPNYSTFRSASSADRGSCSGVDAEGSERDIRVRPRRVQYWQV